ncbi:CidA/LrgA family protein [Lentilactobacillus sp. Marseille-Q4993]|uniref:CidA/LrgA family protein n=1 Tax=Lentilactobacillus sp. Marseille-Q4993 TaxID=3039492 RepID=UPI0024BD21AA|nr:CidA/LrgA family protein [Lentilactobacillus sp. Marseille-Q4993]
MADKANTTQAEKKEAPILVQMGIFAAVLFVSSLISPLFPPKFPVPTPVIGLVLLYLLLTLHIIKLEWVEKFADFMIGLIAFMFVPSGIQLTASLDIMKAQGLQLIIAIIISTVILLVVVAYTTSFFIMIRTKVFHKDATIED